MIRCICDRDCQVRINGRAVMFYRGQIEDFEECPAHFSPLGKAVEDSRSETGVDYDAVSREELLEYDGSLEDLKDFLERKHPDIKFSPSIGYDKLMFRYLEARENKTTTIDNTGKTKNTIVEVKRRLEEAKPPEETPDSDIGSLDDLLGE